LQNARDVYTRRNEGASLWVVRASDIVATQPEDREALLSSAEDKPGKRTATRRCRGAHALNQRGCFIRFKTSSPDSMSVKNL
jgi:phenylacetate-CoA oxygenase PaaH subunit